MEALRLVCLQNWPTSPADNSEKMTKGAKSGEARAPPDALLPTGPITTVFLGWMKNISLPWIVSLTWSLKYCSFATHCTSVLLFISLAGIDRTLLSVESKALVVNVIPREVIVWEVAASPSTIQLSDTASTFSSVIHWNSAIDPIRAVVGWGTLEKAMCRNVCTWNGVDGKLGVLYMN